MCEISIRDNGPLLVSGKDIVLKDGVGERYDLGGKETIALCRCGKTAGAPFCDGSHKTVEFKSECRSG